MPLSPRGTHPEAHTTRHTPPCKHHLGASAWLEAGHCGGCQEHVAHIPRHTPPEEHHQAKTTRQTPPWSFSLAGSGPLWWPGHCQEHALGPTPLSSHLASCKSASTHLGRLKSGRNIPINALDADDMKVRIRENRPGLLYDETCSGFEPALWPHVITPLGACSHRLLLGAVEGSRGEGQVGGATVFDVCYKAGDHKDLIKYTEIMMDNGRAVRGGDVCAGGMVGQGQHMRRTGYVGPFYIKDEATKRLVATAMQVGGARLGEHFVGRDVGWEGMLQKQQELWPRRGGHTGPRCFSASDGLGNAMHYDNDGHRSFAAWVAKCGHRGASSGWWFLLPRHGVAVELVHGTFISWDGRAQPHCTAVPQVRTHTHAPTLGHTHMHWHTCTRSCTLAHAPALAHTSAHAIHVHNHLL